MKHKPKPKRKPPSNQETVNKLREVLKALYVDCKYIEDWP